MVTRLTESDWGFLQRFMPENLSELAVATHAVTRWRNIKDGESLLRLALAYAAGDLSLRSTAGFFSRADLASIKDTSVLYRLQKSIPFLEAVLAHLINHRIYCEAAPAAPIRIVDATVISVPGSVGTDWRIHVVYDPVACRLLQVQVTDKHGGERLDRYEYAAGDLVLADRGLAHARGIHAVHVARAFVLLRMHWQSIRLRDLRGQPMSIDDILARADRGDTGTDVLVPLGRSSVPARLIIRPLPADKAVQAREQTTRNAAKKGRKPTELAVRLAGYFSVLTTLPIEVADDAAVLEFYRARWQIELFFKRCKSLLGFSNLRAFKPELVQTYILSKLIEVALIELLATEGEAFSPWGYPRTRRPASLSLAYDASPAP